MSIKTPFSENTLTKIPQEVLYRKLPAGVLLPEAFGYADFLTNIDRAAQAAEEALNKLVNWIDWEMLGRALGAGLNLALNFLTSFLYAFYSGF